MTYQNECELRVASCRKSQFVMIASQGPCGKTSHTTLFCYIWSVRFETCNLTIRSKMFVKDKFAHSHRLRLRKPRRPSAKLLHLLLLQICVSASSVGSARAVRVASACVRSTVPTATSLFAPTTVRRTAASATCANRSVVSRLSSGCGSLSCRDTIPSNMITDNPSAMLAPLTPAVLQ